MQQIGWLKVSDIWSKPLPPGQSAGGDGNNSVTSQLGIWEVLLAWKCVLFHGMEKLEH